jgi:hypothetical protein
MKRPISLALLTLCGAAACGQSGFIGTWSITNDTFTYTCDGLGNTQDDTGDFDIAASATNSGDLVSTDPNGCNVQWTPNGNTATLAAGQMCSGTVNGVTFDVTYTGGTPTLTSSTVLTVTATANGTANGATCDFSNTFTANLVAH